MNNRSDPCSTTAEHYGPHSIPASDLFCCILLFACFFVVTQCLVLTLKKSVVNKIIVVFIRLQE